MSGPVAFDAAAIVSGTLKLRETTGENFLEWYNTGGTLIGRFDDSGNVRGIDGTKFNPAYTFHAETNTGMYRAGAGLLKLSVLGSNVFVLTSAGKVLIGAGDNNPINTLDVSGNAGLYNGLTPTEFLVHSSYTDTENYVRLRLYTHSTTGDHIIASEALGTGERRNIVLNGANRSAHIAAPTNEQLRDILISHGLMESA